MYRMIKGLFARPRRPEQDITRETFRRLAQEVGWQPETIRLLLDCPGQPRRQFACGRWLVRLTDEAQTFK